jgi:hypothetical protein
MRTKGLRYSAILHAVLLFFLIVGLPDFLHRKMDQEPQAISVDILPIAPMSNVRPQEKPLEKKEEKKPKTEEKKAKVPVPETKKEEEKPAEEPVHIPAKDIVKKEEKKKPQKPKKKPQEDDLEKIFKSVKEQAKAEAAKKPAEQTPPPDQTPAKSDTFNPAMPLSMSEKDAIRSQFQKCWDVPAGAKDAYDLIVDLHVEMNEDGSLIKVELARDESRYASDPFFRAAADSAIRAVERCSPLKNLPTEKYENWRDMELTFNPKDMLY